MFNQWPFSHTSIMPACADTLRSHLERRTLIGEPCLLLSTRSNVNILPISKYCACPAFVTFDFAAESTDQVVI
jgi:hypothetical protein